MVTGSRLKAYAALLGAFLLGGVCAAAVYHVLERREYAEFFSGDREVFEERRVEAMGSELALRGEQQSRVKEIFRRSRDERRRLMREANEACGAPLNAQRERVDAEIRALLTAEQRARFDVLRAERKRRLFGAPAASGSARAP